MPALHSSDEPFYVVLYHNHYQCCNYQIEWLANNPQENQIPKRSEENKRENHMTHSLCTIQNGGQQRLGGWSPAGITKCNNLYRQCIQAKHNLAPGQNIGHANMSNIKPEWVEFENNFLAKLREKFDVKAPAAKNGSKKAAAPEEPAEEPLGVGF